MAKFLLLSLLALPIIEIALFIIVGQIIGLLPTLTLVVLAAIVGGFLLRRQGISVLTQLHDSIIMEHLPRKTIFDTMAIGLAALLLITPGFMSDFFALLLLIPPIRTWIFTILAKPITMVSTITSYADNATDTQINRAGTIDLDDDDYHVE